MEIIYSQIISQYYDHLLVEHIKIDETKKLIVSKYFSPTLYEDVKAYISGYNTWLTFNIVHYKSFGDF